MRQWTLLSRNPLYVRSRIIVALVMSFILGGLYWKRNTDDGLSYLGLFLNCQVGGRYCVGGYSTVWCNSCYYNISQLFD